MGISIREFQVAMKTFGATRMEDRYGSRFKTLVPCFEVRGVEFYHSGSYYIVTGNKKVPDEIMNQAMEEFGEKHPGKNNFWWGEIHTVRGILTLSAMLEHRYSKEYVDKLTNQAYQEILSWHAIQSNERTHFYADKMEELCKLVAEYDNMVNPFGNHELKLKQPTEYWDNVQVGLVSNEKSTHLGINSDAIATEFHTNSTGWNYNTMAWNNEEKGQESGYTTISHYFVKGKDEKSSDEVIYLSYTTAGDYGERPGDIDLRISLKTGLAWKSYQERDAKPATKRQIKTMIAYLKRDIDRVKRNIINHMVEANASC